MNKWEELKAIVERACNQYYGMSYISGAVLIRGIMKQLENKEACASLEAAGYGPIIEISHQA